MKKCLHCKKAMTGRHDKRYCNQRCRNRFNYVTSAKDRHHRVTALEEQVKDLQNRILKLENRP